jgi:hypothetical protein
VSDPGSKAHIAKTRVIVRTAARRPAVLAFRFFDGQVIDAGQTTAHQAILIKLPILIASGTKPPAGIVVPLVGEANRDSILGEGPEFFDQPVVNL